ncbi:putative ribonuclease H-like domain-containing protein [Tanacetum coccineum]
MQKNVLKYQFENFTTTSNESLDKAFDRFQKLISQLEVHGATVSKKDINQKFLRSRVSKSKRGSKMEDLMLLDLKEEAAPSGEQSAPLAPKIVKQLAAKRNQERVNSILLLAIPDEHLLKVYEDEMKKSPSSTSNSQNLAFLSSENTSITNEVSTASRNFGVNTAGGTSSSNKVSSTPSADEVVCSFFAYQATNPPLDNEDLQKNATSNELSSQAMVAQDGLGGYDWINDFDIEPVNYALMAISSSSSLSSSDNEGYELALESLESRILGHEGMNWLGVKNMNDDNDVSDVNTVSPVKTNETQTVKTQADKIGQTSQKVGIGYKKIKACFVCIINPVRPNKKRAVQNFSTARPASTVRPFAPKIPQTSSAIRPIYPIMDNGNPEILLQDHAVVDSGFSSHMTGNKAYLSDYEDYNGGFVAFGSYPKGGKITGKGTQESYVAGLSGNNEETPQEYILFPLHPHGPRILVEDVVQTTQEKPSENAPKDKEVQDSEDVADKEEQHNLKEAEQALKDDLEKLVTQEMVAKSLDDATRQAFEEEKQKIASTKRAAQAISINKLNTDRPSVSTANTPYVSTNTPYVSAASTPTSANDGESLFVYLGGQIPIDASTLPNADLSTDLNMPDLEDDSNVFPNEGIFSGAYDDEDKGAEDDFNNMDNTIDISLIPTLRIHKDHPKAQILGDPKLANITNHKDHQNCLLACFLSQKEPKKISQALEDESWVEAMQEELLQFQLQKVWILVDFPYGKKAIGTKIEAIMLFLAFASFMKFPVYQMDVKSAFLYGTIEEEVYVYQPLGFVDPAHPHKVYKVVKALYGLHQAPRAWYETLSSFLLEIVYVDDIIFGSTKHSMCIESEDCMHKRFQMSSMGELTFFLGLQVKQQPDGIFISQDKYVVDVLKKFDFLSIRTATTPVESNKPLVKDEDGIDIDVHVYRSMIGSLMYLTASRPDIMFAVCACARHQVHPKASHLNAVKRIFRYLKHQPKLGLWYPRDSPFELEAFSDSDYGGASLDRKSTTEYVAAANCCGQVLWIQNQMLDYGFNFMNTKIHIDNESTISVIKNPVSHSRTKHIEIRFHFIRDCYEKRLIEVIKIHTDNNVADLLTKGFDVTRFNFLVSVFLVGMSMGLRILEAMMLGFESCKVYTAIKLLKKIPALYSDQLLHHKSDQKASTLNAVKRIFRYLKHQPKLGLWYPRDSPFELEAFSDNDYGGASLDRKSTTGGCQFLRNLQAGGAHKDKDEDFRRSPYKDKDTEDIKRYS